MTMMTYAEAAQNPESRAIFDKLSPDAQRVASRLVELADQCGGDVVEQFLDAVRGPTNDDPRVTVVDDGQRSGVRLERYDWPGDEPRAWLEFSTGHSPIKEGRPIMMMVVDICGGRRGVGLDVGGHEINSRIDEIWTLDDLRRLHASLGKLLADERLIGALAEQAV